MQRGSKVVANSPQTQCDGALVFDQSNSMAVPNGYSNPLHSRLRTSIQPPGSSNEKNYYMRGLTWTRSLCKKETAPSFEAVSRHFFVGKLQWYASARRVNHTDVDIQYGIAIQIEPQPRENSASC